MKTDGTNLVRLTNIPESDAFSDWSFDAVAGSLSVTRTFTCTL